MEIEIAFLSYDVDQNLHFYVMVLKGMIGSSKEIQHVQFTRQF